MFTEVHKMSPCHLVYVFYSKKQNNWWERNWEAKVQLSERPSESSPWDENGKETKEERSGTRKPSAPLCRQSLAVSLSARVWGKLNSGREKQPSQNLSETSDDLPCWLLVLGGILWSCRLKATEDETWWVNKSHHLELQVVLTPGFWSLLEKSIINHSSTVTLSFVLQLDV